jgi:drug/metabolite transporter (DMT)-like permease
MNGQPGRRNVPATRYDPRLVSISPGALLLVLASSLCWCGFDLSRKVLVGRIRPLPLLFWLTAASVPLFAVWTAVDGMPRVQAGYWAPAVLSMALNVAANLAFFVALQTSPLSVTIPLLSFTPVFTTLLAIPMLGEVPTARQGLGILGVVAGALLLTLGEGEGISPVGIVRSWSRERGARWMIAVALLWSLTNPFDKLATARSSGPFHGMALCAGVAAGALGAMAFRRSLRDLADLRRAPGVFAAALVVSTAALGLQLLAMQQVWVGFVETLKRGIGNLSAVVLGRLVFGEPLTGRKLVAVGLMAAGVGLILS